MNRRRLKGSKKKKKNQTNERTLAVSTPSDIGYGKKKEPNKCRCLNPLGYRVWYLKDADFLYIFSVGNVGRKRALSFKARDDCSFLLDDDDFSLLDESQFDFSGTYITLGCRNPHTAL